MERVYRTGIDIDVALKAAARRALSTPRTSAQQNAGAPGEAGIAIGGAHQASGVPPRQAMRARLKQLLRRPVALGFRLLKPFLRPVAFRIRRYLTEAMHQETLRALDDTRLEVQRMSSDLLREVQAAREMLRQEIITAQVQSSQEKRMLLTELLQEQQATRDLICRLSGGRRRRAGDTGAAIDIASVIGATGAQRLDAQQRRSSDAPGAIEAVLAQILEAAKRHAGDAASTDSGEAAASGTDTTAILLSNLAPRLDRIEQYGYTSARRLVMPCAAGEMMVNTQVGYVMCKDSDLAVLACLADSGDLERGTRLLIERLIQPGDTFVDVGANVGMHTLAAGRAMRGSGRIVAFEPFDTTRDLLRKSIRINGLDTLVEVHGSAVSDQAGIQPLFLGASSGHHSLYDLGADAANGARVDVATVRLESVILPGQHVNLLKIDVEGAELEVLRGALSVVDANPDIALIVEFGPAHLGRTGHTTAQWLDAFTSLGMDYLAIDEHTGMLSKIDIAELEAVVSTNLFFARPGSQPWIRLGISA